MALHLPSRQGQKVDQEGFVVDHPWSGTWPWSIANAQQAPFEPLDGGFMEGAMHREVIMPDNHQCQLSCQLP